MIIKAVADSNLNELFNNETKEELVVELPAACTYRQKVCINRSNVTIIGNGSRIVFNDCNGNYENTIRYNTATPDSATLTIRGNTVLIRDLIVENDFDYETAHKKALETCATMGTQAVAVYIAPGSDEVVFDCCKLIGHQDTLFADGVHNLFVECTIEGNVDFIFGRANADFHNCTIVSNGEGICCAPSTKEDSDMGFTFMDCNFTATEGVKEGSVWLARPWHPWGDEGVNSFMFVSNCKLGEHINLKLWTNMMDSRGKNHLPQENRFIIDEVSLTN